MIGVSDLPEGQARTQVAALCWRREAGGPEILLITSRETGRWVLPKGWPETGEAGAATAVREAWEEAGVKGEVGGDCVGLYAYHKVLGPERGVPCIVAVYPIEVRAQSRAYPEAGERRRKWFSAKKAAARVAEPELREILLRFDPDAAGA